MTACFASASVTNRLLVRFFLGAQTDGNLCAPNRQLDLGVVAALMPGGCGPFHSILHAVLWTYLCVLVFSNSLHFVHLRRRFVLLVFVGGAENKTQTVLFRFPGTLPPATGAA